MKSKKNNKVNPKGLKYLEIKDIKKEREIFDSTSPESPFGSSKHAGNTLYFGSYPCHRTLRVALYVNYWNR